MTALSNYLEGQLINHIFRTAAFTKPTAIYVGLMSAVTDGEAATVTELTGGSYARVAQAPGDANWSAPSAGNGTTSNVNDIVFPTATADQGIATHFGIWDAPTGGNLWISAPLAAARTIVNGATPKFPAGSLTVQLDN